MQRGPLIAAAFSTVVAMLPVALARASDLADYSGLSFVALSDGHIIFRVAGLRGVADRSGKVIIQPHYAQLHAFSKGRAFAIRDRMGGFLSIDGTFEELSVLSQPLQNGAQIQYSASRDLFHVRLKEKEGLLDRAGRWVIPAEYDSLSPAGDKGDPIAFYKSGEAGFINEDGKILLSGLKSAIFVDSRFALGSRDAGSGSHITDYGGRVISGRRYRIFAAVGENIYYGEELASTFPRGVRAGYYRIENDKERLLVPTFPLSSITRVAQDRLFACDDPWLNGKGETQSEGQYSSGKFRLMSGTCNYYDEHGRKYFENSFTHGSAFRNGKAVACRTDLKNRKQYCAWLAIHGRVIVETEVDGSLWAQIADDRVAVLLGEQSWTLFYPDGSKRSLPKH